MTNELAKPQSAILMIAYTNYETDPRVIREAEAAVDGGFAVDFIALRRPGQRAEETVRGVRLLRVAQARYRGKSRLGYVWAYLEFFCRVACQSTWRHVQRRYRVIHVNNMPDALVFAVLIPRLFGAKVILDIHDPMPETLGAKYGSAGSSVLYRALVLIERLSVAFAHRTVTVNVPVKDQILVKHGHRSDAIDVIANFADDDIFTPVPYPAVRDRVRFVFHGTILARYGLRTLVEAVAMVRRRERLQVRIIGEGDFSATLRDLIAKHGLGDVIEFDNRAYPVFEIPRVLAACHVGLVPLDITAISDFALPLKLLEYTCLGLPSITVTSTAITHYFHPDECMFYAPGHAAGLAAHVEAILADPRVLEAYRVKLEGARSRLAWSREREKYVRLLRELSNDAVVVSAQTTSEARRGESVHGNRRQGP